jgi:hypothetical protein
MRATSYTWIKFSSKGRNNSSEFVVEGVAGRLVFREEGGGERVEGEGEQRMDEEEGRMAKGGRGEKEGRSTIAMSRGESESGLLIGLKKCL